VSKTDQASAKLDEATIEAVVRRVSAHLRDARVDPQWLNLRGQAQRHGISRITMWRRLKEANAGVRVRRLSRKLVLYHCGDVDRLLARVARFGE
jgi:hypothetical protein